MPAVQSELFSHRDKNYGRSRVRELARQRITGDNRLEMELKGYGFTEALCALVEQIMEPQTLLPSSVNIETVGWGSEGKTAVTCAVPTATGGMTVPTSPVPVRPPVCLRRRSPWTGCAGL